VKLMFTRSPATGLVVGLSLDVVGCGFSRRVSEGCCTGIAGLVAGGLIVARPPRPGKGTSP